MKRKPARSKSRPAAKSAAGLKPWRISLPLLRAVAVTLAWLAAGAGAVAGLYYLDGYVASTQHNVPLELRWAPDVEARLNDPVLAQIAREVRNGIDLRSDDTLRNDDLVARIARSVEISAWVSKLNSVVKLGDGAIEISAVFRRPLAYVDVNGHAYLVDDAGVRLPNETSSTEVVPQTTHLMLVTGVAAPPPALGESWSGDDLAAGLRLVRFLNEAAARKEVPFAGWLRAIDVGNYRWRQRRTDAPLRLRTPQPQSYINWGEPPGDEPANESSPARKLELLRALFHECGGEFPLFAIDVRDPAGIPVPAAAKPAPPPVNPRRP